ncbi:MAG: Kazal-type serine protease inhibitor [Bdellovibrionales bacterium]|jgi:hypothetical protein|nr:Kazal-type serine protease inhibitor [Bdellovibrionales bacterium]
MKLFMLGMLVSLNLFASVAFEVEGFLQQNQEVILLPQGERIKITYINSEAEACTKGRYLIVNSLTEPEKYELLKVVRCDHSFVCPKIFEPVCGEIDGKTWTFGNACELYESNAIFVDYGVCNTIASASKTK